MFSRPVSSGWNPVPTSSRLAMRPRSLTKPSVGSVMREITLSKVLLPAPFLPINPTVSPSATSKLTSRSAQKRSSLAGPVPFRVPPPKGDLILRERNSRRFSVRWKARPRRYSFDTFRISTIGAMSDDVGEHAFHAPEDQQSENEEENAYRERHPHDRPGGWSSQQRVTKAEDHPCHWVQSQQHLPFFRYVAQRVDYRRQKDSHLNQKWNGVLHVAKTDIQCGERQANACSR